MSDHLDTVRIAEHAFAKIAARFPSLRMVRDEAAPVEISITIPVQPGLKHEIWLCLQNGDELHFGVGGFWLESFPCTDPSTVRHYLDAVIGFISGDHRVLEHYRGSTCVFARLQAPCSTGWTTIGTRMIGFGLLIPWRRSVRELRNI